METNIVREFDKKISDETIINIPRKKTYDEIIDELEENENLASNMPWNTTEQATEISVDDAAKYSRNKLELFGNTEQASYDGKNILKPEYFYPAFANGYNTILRLSEEEDNYLTFIANPGNQSSYNIIFPCKPNTNYVYKCEKIILYNANDEIISESGGWHSVNSKAFSTYTLQDTTGTTIEYTKYVSSRSGALSGTNISGKYVKFTTAEEETECCISFQGSAANKIKIINPMLYEGTDTDIEYEPYTGGQPSPSPDYPQDIHVVTGNNTISIGNTNYPINLGNIELCKIENYQDELFKNEPNNPHYDSSLVENGWYKNEIIPKYITNENETIVTYGSYGLPIFGILSDFEYIKAVCNKYVFRAKATDGNNSIMASWNKRIQIRDDRFVHDGVADVTSFRNDLANNKLILYYVKKDLSSEYIQITDETLISQLNEINEHLKLIKGTNNITVTAEDLAPNMQLTYMQDLNSKFNKLEAMLLEANS